MRELLRHRDFRLLMAGQTLSMFGDTAMLLVLAMWAKELTGSNGVAGSIFAALALPTLLAPLGGVVIDRFRRRTVMIVTDVATAAVVLLLLFVDGREDLWLLYVVAFSYGASLVAFQRPVGPADTMLPDALLGQANGSLSTVREALRLIGPARRRRPVRRVRRAAVAVLDAATFLSPPPPCSRCGSTNRRRSRRAALPHRGRAGGRHLLGTPGAARHRRRDGHLHARHRHQRVGLLRGRRRGARPSRSRSSACWEPSRAWARSSAACHHLAHPRAPASCGRGLGFGLIAVGVLLVVGSDLLVVGAGSLLFGAGLPIAVVCITTMHPATDAGRAPGPCVHGLRAGGRAAPAAVHRRRRDTRQPRRLSAAAGRHGGRARRSSRLSRSGCASAARRHRSRTDPSSTTR